MLTPEAFAEQQRRQKASARRQNTKSVNLRPVNSTEARAFSGSAKRDISDDEEDDFQSVEHIEAEETPESTGNIFLDNDAAARAGSQPVNTKIKAQIKSSVKNRYMKEIQDVSPTLKKQFWKDFTRKSGKSFAGVAVRGWRDYMEDCMDIFHTRSENLAQLFAVYDGHGGSECSVFCERFMLKRLAMHAELKSNPKNALSDTFLQINERFIKQAKKSGSIAGSTATVLYVNAERDSKRKLNVKYFLSFVGDSRAVLIYKNGKVVPLSEDHHLTRKDELERVKSANGEVRYDDEFDETLVYSTEIDRGLAVTRSIGDREFKPVVSASPEINEGFLDENCAYICVATDGLWAKVSNQKVGQILLTHGKDEGIDILANLANARSVFDNITIIAINCVSLIEELRNFDN